PPDLSLSCNIPRPAAKREKKSEEIARERFFLAGPAYAPIDSSRHERQQRAACPNLKLAPPLVWPTSPGMPDGRDRQRATPLPEARPRTVRALAWRSEISPRC